MVDTEQYIQLLKGTHMGAFVLKDLKEKVTDFHLREILEESLKRLHDHEIWLTHCLEKHGGSVPDTQGIQGMIANAMMKVMNLMLEDDKEIVKEAMKAIENGQKALRIFEEEHLSLDALLMKQLKIMYDDYAMIYHRLHQYSLECERKKLMDVC